MLTGAPEPDETCGRDDSGFALVETLVALGILAVALGVLYAVFTDGLRRAGHAQRLSEASLQAQSLLARVGADLALEAGETTGALPDGSQWQLHIEPYGDASDRKAWPADAYRVIVRISLRDAAARPLVELATLRLAPKATRK